MFKLHEELPAEIIRVLDAIDFQFDAEKQWSPIYFASYSEVKMQGWDTAEENLKKNLTEILEILKQDEYIEDRENKIRILTLNIESLDLSLGFYSDAFFWTHRNKYLRTVGSLNRGKRSKNYSDFRYAEIGELRKLEPRKKVRRKITIPDDETQITYKAYLIDFKKDNFNPNIKEYKRLSKKINPKNLIRYPISEIYEFFECKVKFVYKNRDIRKNSLDKGYSFLKDLSRNRSRGLTPHRFTPFGYKAVPDFLKGDEKEIMLLTGGQVAGLAGGGGADYYELKDGGYVFKERFNYWVS